MSTLTNIIELTAIICALGFIYIYFILLLGYPFKTFVY